MASTLNSFKARKTLTVGAKTYDYCSLPAVSKKLDRLPMSLKLLLENLLRREDGRQVKRADIDALLEWDPKAKPDKEIAFMPARVLLQDFTGVPAVVDLAAMRDALVAMGGDPKVHQPAAAGGSGHRPLGASRRLRQRGCVLASTPNWSRRATGSATPSCAGGRRPSSASAWCRPTPASCTR